MAQGAAQPAAVQHRLLRAQVAGGDSQGCDPAPSQPDAPASGGQSGPARHRPSAPRAALAIALACLAAIGCGATGATSTHAYPETGLVLLSLKDGPSRGSTSIGSDVVAVIVSDDGRTAYLADSAPGDVYSVTLPELKVAWKQLVGGAPFGLLLHGGRLFVSLFDGAAVLELDPKSGNMVGTHQVAQGAAAMATDASGQVVVAGTRGQLNVIGGGQLRSGNGFGVALAGGRLWT